MNLEGILLIYKQKSEKCQDYDFLLQSQINHN